MPIFPLHDDNPIRRIPFQYVTVGLIALCVLVWLYQWGLPDGVPENAFAAGFGVVPVVLFDGTAGVPGWLNLVTYAFLHAGFWHLSGNMAFLYVFGDNIEDELGHGLFAAFYLVCAAAAGLTHAAVDPGSQVPLIGASGAVSGVIGAYLVLHPHAKVWVLALGRIPLKVPAWLALGAWIVFQLVMALFVAPAGDSIAWLAHVAGFIAGVALILPLRRREPAVEIEP